jgi:hypothetical protein
VIAAEDPRVGRAHDSADIVRLALQQIENDLADVADPAVVAEILRELFREDAPDDGVFGALVQLLTAAGHAADRASEAEDLEAPDGEVSALLEEGAGFISGNVAMLLHYATRTLHPEGERP